MKKGGYFFVSIIAVAVMLVCVSQKAMAGSAFVGNQSGASRQSLELYGGYVEDFAIDATTGTVYAGLNSPNGIFYSTDAGASWIAPPEGSDFGSIIAVEASDEANTAYIIGGISVFKTSDGGKSWTELAGSSGKVEDNDYSQTMLYSNGALFVPVRDGTIDISTNEGVSFTNVTVASAIQSLDAFAASSDGSVVYVLARGSDPESRTLYYSTDAGKTWQSTGKTGNYSKVAVKPTNTNFVMLAGSAGIAYTTGGATGSWTTATTEQALGTITFNGNRIFVSGRYSDDNGATWQTIAALSQEGGTTSPQRLIVDPADSTIMYGATSIGIAKTSDGAAHWTDINTGLLGITVNGIAQTSDKKTVWLATIGGLARSDNFLDSTVTWDFPILPNPSITRVNHVWIHPINSNTLVVSAGALSRSTDNGKTWTEVQTSSTPGNFTDIISTADGTKMYVGFSAQDGSGTVYESTDDGSTWINVSAPNVAVNALGLLEDGSVLAGVGTENNTTAEKRGLYRYNGSSWEQLTGVASVMVNDIEVAGDTVFVVGGSTEAGGVYRSTDGGITWEDLTKNGLEEHGWYHAVAVENSTAKAVYVSGGRPAGTGYIYKSLDSGGTWEKYYQGLVDEQFSALLFDGLLSGTNTGLYDYRSKVTFITRKMSTTTQKNAVTVTLKDKVTKQGLVGQVIRLFAKNNNGKFVIVKTRKTNSSGKAKFTVAPSAKLSVQARWKPKGVAAAAYGAKMKRSNSVRF